MFIYIAKNKVNGKCYVGQTIHTLRKRTLKHLSHVRNGSKTYFHNALRKHGKGNFIWEVLEKCECKEEMDEMEFHYIKQYNTYWKYNGYNLSWGGDGNGGLYGEINGMFGKEHSMYSKEKMVKNRKGKCLGKNNPAYKSAPKYIICTPDGEYFKIKNMREFCRNNGVNRNHLNRNSHGWKCERIE